MTLPCGILNPTWHYLILVLKLISAFFLHYIDLCVNKIQLNMVAPMNNLVLILHFPEAFVVSPASDPTTLPTGTKAEMPLLSSTLLTLTGYCLIRLTPPAPVVSLLTLR